MNNPNLNDDFVICATDDNIGCRGKALQRLLVNENVSGLRAEPVLLQPQQQARQALNAVTRSQRAQQQLHTLQPTAPEFVPQAKREQPEKHCEVQGINISMPRAVLEIPAENESIDAPHQVCSERARAAAGESIDAARMFTSNSDDLDTPPVNTPILSSERPVVLNGTEPLELSNKLDNDSTKDASENTTVVPAPGSSSEFIDKSVAEGLQLAAERKRDGLPALAPESLFATDLFTSERKAAGLQPQSSAGLDYSWLHENAKTKFCPTDYSCDSEFYPMYLYLSEGKLTGNNDTDKKRY